MSYFYNILIIFEGAYMSNKIFFVLALFPLIFLSCDRNAGEEILYSPDLKMPVVTGLYFMGYDSPEVLGYWRNPSGSSFCYPNLDGMTNIRFSIPENLEVKIWVVPARLPEQKSVDVLQSLSGYFTSASGQSVAILMNGIKQAGTYMIEYHFTDSKGNTLPEGFYRIYIQTKKYFSWCDVLNFRNESNYYKEIVNQILK